MENLEQVKKRLEDRLVALGAKIDEIEGDLRTVPSADFEEQATETEDDEVLAGLETSALSEVRRIRVALERIRDGSYGACANCGAEIGEKRLEAVPDTVNCIDCAR